MNTRREILEKFEQQKEISEKRIAEGIEKYRKGDAKIIITNENGAPVSDAKIKVVQKSHEFRFGANLFMLDEFETGEKNEKYREYFADVFNMATLPFYWKDVEPTPGNMRFSIDSEKIYRRPAIDLCIQYCKEHNIEPREHCLNYDYPAWVIDKPVPYVKEKLEERIRNLAERYSEDIHCWEVTNETLLSLLDQKMSPFYRERDYVEWSFKTAEKYLKKNQLVINDATANIWSTAFNYDRSAYYMQIESELKKATRIDAIGLQFHMFHKKEAEKEKTKFYYEPKHLYDVMDTYAEFNKPLHITEVTIPSYSNDAEDEAIQAEIIEILYSIWFSHPNVEQIIYWNLVDGYAAFAPQGDMTAGENYFHGGLFRFDFSPKPAYFKLKKLIQEKWHSQANLITDKHGSAYFKGFYGQYELEIDLEGKIVKRIVEHSSKSNNEIKVEI